MEDTDPFEEVLSEMKEFWQEEEDAFARVCTTILDITDYTHYPDIAEVADCAPNTAKKHLDRLTEMGIVERHPTLWLAVYRRSDSYLEWRVTHHIAEEYSTEEMIERVEALESREEALREKIRESREKESTGRSLESHEEVPDENIAPSPASFPEANSGQLTSEYMRNAEELVKTRRRMKLYELARHVPQNERSF